MEKMRLCILVVVLLLLHPVLEAVSSTGDRRRGELQQAVYIVYLGGHAGQKTAQEIEENHHSCLLSVKETAEDVKTSLVYSYKRTINGFAAFLTEEEAAQLSEREEVVSVFPSRPGKYKLHTTRSWEFLGLIQEEEEHTDERNQSRDANSLLSESNIIIGMLDTGVWPESRSFHDRGMGPVPKSWKGNCQSGEAFPSSTCNRKIIGARYYIKGYEAELGSLNNSLDVRSPRDMNGHGTHTASTAAGRVTKGASAMGGFAAGIASGAAPMARLAIYKVCWANPHDQDGSTCFDADILAALDDAIADGVHVLSVSIGAKQALSYHEDGLAIGAIHAVQKGIPVAFSAGNDGPNASTLVNPAPWTITVAASSIDRQFLSPVKLGSGIQVQGQTVTPYHMENKLYPLVFAGDITNPNVPKNEYGQCLPGSLSPEKAQGKIVLCSRGDGTRVGKGMEVKRAGGIGYILANNEAFGNDVPADPHLLPATALNYQDGLRIMKYINSTNNPTACIVPASTVLHTKPAPFMAVFSSRGPSTTSPQILKPDITAPGLNILAAWSEASSPSTLPIDKRSVKYNIMSGTSMSCPHVAGALALLKAVHSDWSSAALRSAIMTTANLINNEGNPITDAVGNMADSFQFGSGQLNPRKAVNPGLVYNTTYKDYLLFLCSFGVKNIDPLFVCPQKLPSPLDLNYPSLAVPRLKLNSAITVTRTLTNVGSTPSVYYLTVKPPPGITVKISPSTLHFNHTGQKDSFTITVKADRQFTRAVGKQNHSFGWYTWSDGVHVVQSPMAISVI